MNIMSVKVKRHITQSVRKNTSKSARISGPVAQLSYSSNNVCGRTKIQEYNGHKFHGSWEVDVAKWLDNHGVKWERDIKPLPYFWNGNWRNYFPDFYLPDYALYIEVKGYETERDRAKWSSLENLFVMKKKEIEKIRYNCSVEVLLGR